MGTAVEATVAPSLPERGGGVNGKKRGSVDTAEEASASHATTAGSAFYSLSIMPYAQPAGTFNDSATGSMPFGSQTVTINGIVYLANSVNIKRPVTVLTGKNQFSVPFRETEIVDVYTCDLELQLADVTTAAPVAGMPFELNDVGSGNAPVVVNFKVQDVSPKWSAGAETLVSVTGRQRFAA